MVSNLLCHSRETNWNPKNFTKMPQPLIRFEYVIQNVEEDQDVDMVSTNVHPGSTNNTTGMSEMNNNHLNLEQHPNNNGLHQIKIVRSNSNVGGGGGDSHRQNFLTNHAHHHLLHHHHQQQQQSLTNNQMKNNMSTTEIWHHGPR